MDNTGQPRRTGMGRARLRARGVSPSSVPSPDPSTLTSNASTFARSDSDSSPSASSTAAQVGSLSISEGASTAGAGGFHRGGPASMRAHHHTGQESRVGYVLKTRPDGLDKQGKKGKAIPLQANYFRLKAIPSWSLHQYSVQFDMEDDRISVRKKLLRKAMEEQKIVTGYLFDGAQLFTAKLLKEDVKDDLVMTTKLDREGDPEVKMTVTFTKKVVPGEPIYAQLYNILIRKCLFGLQLQEMGRNFFDPKAAIKLPRQKLELWPGYVTSMRTHEGAVLLCVEVTHKVLRTDSVLQIIRELEKNHRGDNMSKKSAVLAELKDTIVMTTYNKKTYHVDDIDFTKTPRDTFKGKKDEIISYQQYYKDKYNLTITDLDQPLIISRPSKKDFHRGDPNKKNVEKDAEEKDLPEGTDVTGSEKSADKKDDKKDILVLVPEFCQSTGLTDAMRADFHLMKELSKYLHQMPKEKVNVIEGFMKRLKSDEAIRKDFENWGLEFDNKLVNLSGRVLDGQSMVFAKGTHPVDAKGDFTMAFRSQQMLSAVQMDNWSILVPQRDAQGVDNLVRTMSKVATPLSMRIANPKLILKLADVRPQTYLRHLEEVIKKEPHTQMIFVILPTNKLDLYACVKKRLAVDQGIPSQCFLAKNVGSKGLMSIATKVVVQMNAKLGGEPWSVKLPLKNTMFIGFDVHKGGNGIVGAMVATFSPNFTKYYSTTSMYKSVDQLCKDIRTAVKKCVLAYQEENGGQLPEKIFMYRDGVGEGCLKMVYDIELVGIKAELNVIYKEREITPPGLTYIVVTKKINTRLVEMKSAGSFDNPPPGTVVDDVVTLPERYDFFLISCGARQGTVSPCSYNVLCDGSGYDADRIQLITYKMCHMYFNWSGTIAVPAPCQYAHKLAFLTGLAYSGHANEKLSKLLHFL